MSQKFQIAASVAALLLFSHVSGAPRQIPIVEDTSYMIPSRILFDYATHVLQTGKIAAALQNVDNSYVYPNFAIPMTYTFDSKKDVCSGNNSCESIHEFVKIGGLDESNEYEPYTTLLSGALDNDVRVVFDLSNFTYTFNVPSLTLNSTDFQRIVTNLNTDVQDVYSGLFLKVANSTLGISADFDFQGHYSVSNVKVVLDLGEVSMKVTNVAKRENGTWTDLPPVDKDAAPQVMELWKETDESGATLEKRYSEYIEQQINDILAGRTTL